MEHAGEKTEQATPRRLEEAIKRGQYARSQEIQTVFVLAAVLLALVFIGPDVWRRLGGAMAGILGHLHSQAVTPERMQGFFLNGALLVAQCVGPIVLAALLGGLLAGGIQSRFQTASEALEAKWERLNPIEGLKRIFSTRALAPLALNLVKLATIVALSYTEVSKVLNDPIFYSVVDATRIASFMASAAVRLALRVGGVLALIAVLDYAYQFWRTNRDLMMTKEEVKEELKNTEGDPHIKAAQRRRRMSISKRKMLAEVPKADVIVTNPTHIAIALRYDRKTMKAPKIVAKGIRLNAQRIREIASQHNVPILENKPLARLLFKYGKVGSEIPAQLYTAVAEVLAWVYRVNRYRYYTEGNQIG